GAGRNPQRRPGESARRPELAGAVRRNQAVRDPGAALPAVPIIEPLRIVVVDRGDPVEPDVTVLRSVCQAGVEQRRAHAMIAKTGVQEEIIHHQDAVGNQGVEAGIERRKTMQPTVSLREQPYTSFWNTFLTSEKPRRIAA